MVIISSGDFKATIKLSSLTEARVEKELGDYCVQLMGEGGAPTLSLMLDGSVPHKDATKAWRELRAMFGESCVFDEDDAGGVMFSWSDA